MGGLSERSKRNEVILSWPKIEREGVADVECNDWSWKDIWPLSLYNVRSVATRCRLI